VLFGVTIVVVFGATFSGMLVRVTINGVAFGVTICVVLFCFTISCVRFGVFIGGMLLGV
jgi:hypothetical protein